MSKYKELLIEVMELHLRGTGVMNLDSFNTLIEYAPLAAEEVSSAFCVDTKEFRQIIEDKSITLVDIKHKILNV
mgnify:CR=1 FL=1|jgi:hypothetical protein